MIKLARIIVLLAVCRTVVAENVKCSTNSGFSPYPNDCEKYKLCILGGWRDYNCGVSMKWDQGRERCTAYNPLRERCSPRFQDFTTTALPPQTSSNRQTVVDDQVSQEGTPIVSCHYISYWINSF